ncbi:hypothetical protein BD410DRAFT_739738 [Rickenella mellea]|uniref:Zn(2)-C6 fungal-type domain-containing protein n=1 Tax=Rickenella mellea TaxID=50990 RepID=A0A4Y7QLS4_9AGAM|nr:hypothetical protein BD410DRAFT_739738 [Rickenella mellea]
MSHNRASSGNGVKKQEDGEPSDPSTKDDKRDVKPAKTLNRVPRACNACRKQKMRCEGADNPPCRRCRHASLECLFEKPSREPTLTGEAGLERIRSLEAQVADVQQSQAAIHNTLSELVHALRAGIPSLPAPSSSIPPPFRQSPLYSSGSPQTPSSASTMMVDPNHSLQVSQVGTPDLAPQGSFAGPHGGIMPLVTPSQPRQPPQRGPAPPTAPYRNPSISGSQRLGSDMQSSLIAPNGGYSTSGHLYPPQGSGHQGPTLPPISSLQDIGSQRPGPSNVSSVRYHPADGMPSPRQAGKRLHSPGRRSPKWKAPGSSNVTSTNTSDVEDDDNGELPASGLVAPWEVLRGLADAATERANQESGEHGEPNSRGRSPSPGHNKKRRKTHHKNVPRALTFRDVVSKNIINEADARSLFKIYYEGCSTFLPVFDVKYDTFESLHERSPFAFNCICWVAAKVRDGGGPPSDIATKCLDEVQSISCATLFSPVSRQEAVQAMILVSGWSDNGWLSGGHAVRMAVELSMHQAWPKLLKRIEGGKAGKGPEDRKLITAARTWFCLYLFEHQMSYGTGRPAILKDDESIWGSRLLLKHPLAIEDDMRLCSTVELMAIRERVHGRLSPVDRPVDEQTFTVLRDADIEFRNWFDTWDAGFSQKYPDAAFYRQSLQIQQLLAQLFHNATALRGIDGPEDVLNMPPVQRDLALQSLTIAQKALSICINSPSYREGLKYAVHYTHATATFTASFLLRLGRLFPDNCDMQMIRMLVERLAEVLSQIPARRYAYTLQLMLKKSRKRERRPGSGASQSRSPTVARPSAPQGGPVNTADPQVMNHPMQHESMSPIYERGYPSRDIIHQSQMQMGIPGPHGQINVDAANLDQIWRGFEGATNEQLPVWLSDQSLGGASFSQLGLEAFMMPLEYDQQHRTAAPQIW